MADQWRLGPLPTPAKRTRTDYGSYIPGDRLDDGRSLWRDPENISGTNNLIRNGMAYGPPGVPPPSDLGLVGGPGIGAGGYGNMGAPGLGAPSVTAGSRPLPDVGMGLHGGRPEPRSLGASNILPPDASPTLYIEGFPSDTTCREASHIFRPFIGFKEVRLVHKESKRASGEKLILCFVDFADARYSAIALEALQGYKFDKNDPDSPILRLQFARFLGRRAGPRNDFRGGHDDSLRFQ